jgi:hypothetical protein
MYQTIYINQIVSQHSHYNQLCTKRRCIWLSKVNIIHKSCKKKVALSLLSLWLWSYGSWIHVFLYLCNQCLSPLKLWFRIPFMANKSSCVVLDTTLLCDKVCQWLKLATGQVIGFYRVLGFPLPNRGIQLKATISLKSRWKWHYILNTI